LVWFIPTLTGAKAMQEGVRCCLGEAVTAVPGPATCYQASHSNEFDTKPTEDGSESFLTPSSKQYKSCSVFNIGPNVFF
jgi:hypothetical protein